MHRGEGADGKFEIFFRSDASDDDDDGGFGAGVPACAEVVAAFFRGEEFGIDAATHEVDVAEAFGLEFFDDADGGGEGAIGSTVEALQVGHGEGLQAAEAVAFHVFVEIGVKAGGDGDAECFGGFDGGFSKGAFGGDVDGIRAAFEPAFAEFERFGQADADFAVAGEREGGGDGFSAFALASADDVDAVAALAEAIREASESHGHTVDVRGEGIGHDVDFHDRK